MKTALITGVTRSEGLGYETAKQLMELGFQVIVSGRDRLKIKALADSIGVDHIVIDITSDESVSAAAAAIASRYQQIDALINNAAGYFDAGAAPLDTSMDFVKDAFDTNLLGAWRMIKAFEPLLAKSGSGRIVNVSSTAGSFSDPLSGIAKHPSRIPVYSLTKLALNGLTINFAREFEGTTIKVNSVCPGFIATHPGTEKYGARPVSEGAAGVVWAATLAPDGPTGGFFRDGKAIDW